MSVDVRGKQGYISKTVKVDTNDPKKPVSTLSVRMYLKDRVHMNHYKAAEIFGEKCRECHIDKGRGLKGSKKPEEYLIRIIRKGVENTVMPGWEKRIGGPLDDAEIGSLIDLITQ